MQLTYNQALDTIIENTEIGYSIRSQDRLWICFIYDLWSDGDLAELRFNRLYPMGLSQPLSYDKFSDGVLMWTTRDEAESYAARWRKYLDDVARLDDDPDAEKTEVYVMNLGDDARFEDQVLGGYKRARTQPKFAGSRDAWQAMIQMHMRWMTYAIERAMAEKQDEEPSCP
jgi:hypothetical protein